MVLFQIFVAPGSDPGSLFTADTLRETQAQVMTVDEARKVGFQGVPDPPPGVEVRLVAVAKRDAPWIHRALETNEAVAKFSMFDID